MKNMKNTKNTNANKISEWAIQNDKYKASLQLFKELALKTPEVTKVKEVGSTFDVTIVDGSVHRYGVVYDKFMNPEFKSWRVK